MQPFLKWPGGKRWLVQNYPSFFIADYNRYVEPFLGGAAVFFSFQPKRALLSDLNVELIETYTAIKNDWRKVKDKLKVHHNNHLKQDDYYYYVRSSRPTSPSGLAAKFIYLNRTCFNGLYRVNLQGKFNVPRGTKDTVYTNADDYEKISDLLLHADLRSLDFEQVLNECGKGDFVFVDPPYTVAHNNNGFLKYNEKIFSWNDQLRLARCVAECANRGAQVLVTNANHPSLQALYGEMGDVKEVSRFSRLASESARRRRIEEIVVMLNPQMQIPHTPVVLNR